jgi:signal transduction histidine kinase
VLLSTTLANVEQARGQLAATNAQLLATQALLEDSVRDRERLRIARELHDLIGHKLTALQLNLQVAGRVMKAPHPSELDTARGIAGEILKDIRNVVAYVPMQPGVSIDAALVELARAFPRSLVRVEIARDVRVDDMETAQCILRGAQEATSNAVRHGQATDIVISLAHVAGELVLSVQDNGVGMLGAQPGFGLASVESRVRELGGRLELRAIEPRGTELRLLMPRPSI